MGSERVMGMLLQWEIRNSPRSSSGAQDGWKSSCFKVTGMSSSPITNNPLGSHNTDPTNGCGNFSTASVSLSPSTV